MTDEAWVKKELKEFFKSLGVFFFMPATGGYGKSGIPDFVACANGQFWGIEAKGLPSNRTTALQRIRLADMLDSEGSVAVVDRHNLEEFKKNFTLALGASSVDYRREADKVIER